VKITPFALFLLGLHARHVVYRHGSLGLAFGSRYRGVVASVFGAVIGSSLKTFISLVFVAYFEVVSFQIVVAHVLPHGLRKAGWL